MRVRSVNNSPDHGYVVPMALVLFAVLITLIVLVVNTPQTNLVIMAGTNGLTACFAAYVCLARTRAVSGIDPVEWATMLDVQDRIRGAQMTIAGELGSIREHMFSLRTQSRPLPLVAGPCGEVVEILAQVKSLLDDYQEHADTSGCYTMTPSQFHEVGSLLAMADGLMQSTTEAVDERAA